MCKFYTVTNNSKNIQINKQEVLDEDAKKTIAEIGEEMAGMINIVYLQLMLVSNNKV